MSNVIDLGAVRLAKMLKERDARLTPEELQQRNAQDAIDWAEPWDERDEA